MTAVLIVFGILVGVGLVVLLPWALLRKLEAGDPAGNPGEEDD